MVTKVARVARATKTHPPLVGGGQGEGFFSVTALPPAHPSSTLQEFH